MQIPIYDNYSTQQSSPETFFDDKGHFYYDYDGALLDLNKTITLNDKFTPAYISRAQLYRAIHKNDFALKDLNQVIKLDDNNFDAYLNRANLYRDLKLPKESLADFNRAIEIKPENPFPYANRGYLKMELFNDKIGGCEDLQKAQELGLPMSDEAVKTCQ